MSLDPIPCSGSCKRSVTSEDAAMAAGWSFLLVVRRWRCGSCANLLRNVSKMPTNDGPSVDLLKPEDRGALPVPGSFGIVPVAVKG